MKKVFYSIGLALIVSCAPRLHFAIDKSFTEIEVREIHRAAEEWNKIALRKITFGDDGKYYIDEVEKTDLGYNGFFTRKRRLIQIDNETGGVSVYAIALHEFGHALGLNHVNNGIMNPNKVTTEFSAEDMAECRRVRACK